MANTIGMGIAAYDRGSKAIGDQLYPRSVFYAPAKLKPVDPLPNGVLRSGFLPETYLAGTAVFLTYQNGWYIVCTHFQTFKRRRTLEPAVKIFENLQLYGQCALEDRR